MKVSDLINFMAFSHRQEDGISVGIAVVAGVAYMATGFVRDGDSFHRKLSHRVLAQRIISTIDGNDHVRFVQVAEHLPEKVDARALVREFRKLFKPNPECNDGLFSEEDRPNAFFKALMVRQPMPRDEAWKKISGMFDKAVEAASAQAVA